MLPESDRDASSVSKAEESQIAPAKRPIAFFIPGLEGGGAQRVFVTLVNTLVTMTDHPIHLVTSRAGGVFAGQVDERVLRVVLGPKHVSRSVFRLAAYIRRERPVSMISTLDYGNVVFLFSAILARVRVRKVIRDAVVLTEQSHSRTEGWKSMVVRFLMRVTYRYADDMVIITDDVAQSLLEYGIGNAKKMRRIPNPVLLPKVNRISNPDAHDPMPAKPFILGIGRLSHQKGFDVLIRAFSSLPVEDLNLLLLGEGPVRKELELLAVELGVRKHVIFGGFTCDTSRYLEAASLFVLSSRWEGFSNVLMEALASGTPIVSTDCPGSAREVLENGRLGPLVPVDDPEALAKTIASELRSLTATAQERRHRASQYAPELIAKQYLDVLLQRKS